MVKKRKIQIVLFVLLMICVLCVCGCEKKEVVFQTNGGHFLETITAKKLESAPVPQRSGYTFLGWYIDNELSQPAVFPLELSDNVTLYAKWEKIIHTVFFVSNGGSKVDDQTVEIIQTAPLPIRTGYLFDGWYLDKNFSELTSFPLEVNKDIVLYAKWRELPTVTFECNGGVSLISRKTELIDKEPETQKAGYIFKGWYTDEAFIHKATFPLEVKENITLFAKWEKNVYTVSFETADGTAIDPRCVEVLEYSPTTVRNGYIFKGWYRDEALHVEAKFPLEIMENMILYAKWEKILYLVSFDSNGGSYCATLQTTRINEAPLPSKSWYTFDGWYRDAALTERVGFPLDVNKDMILYAKWLRTHGLSTYEKFAIKYLDNAFKNEYKWSILPNEFDYMRLALDGYTLNIDVSYKVYYEQDYKAIGNIGYMGSPKYEIAIYDKNGVGTYASDLGTSGEADERTISLQIKAIDLLNNNIYIEISTNNVQNIIYFEDLEILYRFVK